MTGKGQEEICLFSEYFINNMRCILVLLKSHKESSMNYSMMGLSKILKLVADPGDGMLNFERGKKGKHTPLTCLTCLCMPVM